jgi:hypothetical protein
VRALSDAALLGVRVRDREDAAAYRFEFEKAERESRAAREAAEAAAIAAANAAELARQNTAADAETRRRAGQSAYDILLSEFNQYGLGALVEPLKGLIQSGPSSAELTLALRATDAYQKRFAANKSRVAAGLRALDEATYVRMEDQYQNVMRNYGLPASYYAKDSTGRQEDINDSSVNAQYNFDLSVVMKMIPNRLSVMK